MSNNVFWGQSKDGKLSLGSEANAIRFREHLRKNPNGRYRIEAYVAESRAQRGFFEGAVIPLFAYLDGHDYKDSYVIKYLRDNYIKPEFNGEVVIVNKKPLRVGKTTKRNLQPMIDKVIDWMEEQYGIDRVECLNPKDYKKFRDEVFPTSSYECYIDFLIDMKKLPAVYLKKQ